MNTARTISEDLQIIGGSVARAQAEVETGQVIDLSPLETEVEILCSRVQQLPADEGQSFRPRLLTLIDEFGRLARTIEQKLKELKGTLGETSDRRQAISAYGKNMGPKK
ncbi:MAG: hypothetical protein V3S40_13740 [Kiloniellales bacterium]